MSLPFRNKKSEKGFVLLAVIAFIAILLPIIILVLSTVSTETISVGEAVKGSKAETAAEMAVSNALSLIVQEKQLPNFWVSYTQPQNAIIVDDGFGNRRDQIQNNGAGLDGVYGTNDDYWIGPRRDRSFLPGDDPSDPRNYNYDFRYLNNDGPTYLAQRWAFSLERHPFFFVRTPQAGSEFVPVQLYNQFSAVQSDQDADGVPEGFIPDALDLLQLPGYFPSAMPRNGPVNLDLTSPTIAQDMLSYRTRLYEGIPENLEEGPIPSTLTRSYASVTDENGRLNLNIFSKKLRLWLPESANYDTFYTTGTLTSDFNNNAVPGEWGWHWVDNPLFPDSDTTIDENGDPIDFGSLDPVTGFPSDTLDGVATAELGETVQHLYRPGWERAAVKSKRMLMALPGVDETIAENILRALNPDLSAFTDQSAPTETGALPNADNLRLDAPNLTPNLMALDVTIGIGGDITDFAWRYDRSLEDDLPLPPPRPFNDIKELLNVEGITPSRYERLEELVTVFSYDTNVIQNYISDVSSNVDPINPPDLPLGASRRPIPEYLVDNDSFPDLRYNINKWVEDTSLAGLKEEADILFNFIMNHLPPATFNKFTLPVIDRAGRGPSDHLQSGFRNPWDGDFPYNVGETGHEFPLTDPVSNMVIEAGTGYASLDPPFSRDSALSILLYRHGMVQETAYHRYHPDADRPREPHPGIPVPGTRSFIPIVNPISVIPGLLTFYFQPTFIPEVSISQQYAVIPPHNFSSAADLLEVPIYKFSQFNVDIMADPPSSSLCASRNENEVTVRYYVSLSDIVKPGEYSDNGTPLDLTDDTLLYTYDLEFDYNNDGVPEESLPLTLGDNLRLVGSAPTPQSPGIITTFNQATGERFVVFEHTFNIAEVPDPDKSLAGTASGDFAFDAFGNPFIVGRVAGIKAVGTPDETFADAIVRVYVQENCEIPPPLKVSIMAVRQSEDSFLLMSAVGGGVEDPNPLRIYDWEFNGSPQNINGTYPPQAPPNDRDPRTAVVTLQSSTVKLTVYDMYSGGLPPGIGMRPPDKDIPPGIWVAMWLPNGRLNPGFASNWDLLPESKDSDVIEVELVGTVPQVRAEVAVEPPSISSGGSVLVHMGAYGGTGPYDFSLDIVPAGGGVPVATYFLDNWETNTASVELTSPAFAIQGNFDVILTVTDSTTPAPTADVDTTVLRVEAAGGGGARFTNVPPMTASINLEELDLPDKGFRATMSVSGNRGQVGYYWEVFNDNGTIATDFEGRAMRSNEPAPVFRFDPSAGSDGIYIVKGMAIDQTNINPNIATNTTIATDSAMVVLSSAGGEFAGEPTAVVTAIPPGNGLSALDTSPMDPPLIYGAGPAPVLTTEAGVPAITPEVAPEGAVVELRGYYFNATPENNFVNFGGGVSGQAFEVVDDPSYAGPPPVRRILRVIVPDGARSGWVNVSVNVGGNGGVSNSVFFQTHFMVEFELTGSVSPQVDHNYLYELDYQGDGIYDVRIDTSVGTQNPRKVGSGTSTALQHDYALDGFGNYQATLKVTDLSSGKVEISRQLVQIRNLRPLIDDPDNAPEAFGLITSLIPSISERFPLPGSGLTVYTSTGGMSSVSGIRYKWNIDGNTRVSRQSTTVPSPVNPGQSIGVNVTASASSDGRYVSPGIPVKYFADLRFNFTTTDNGIFNITLDETSPPFMEWDFEGDGLPDYSAPAFDVSSEIYTGSASGLAENAFPAIGDYFGLLKFRAQVLVTDNNNNTFIVPIVFGTPVNLPQISVSNVLNTLYLPTLGNDTDHLISVIAVAEEFDAGTGLTRFISATDTVYIPNANSSTNNVFAFSGVQPPYSLGNTPNSLYYTLIGTYGSGAPLSFWADINTDGFFEIGQLAYPNPQSVPRVTAQNGLNLLNPGATNSFPTILPGVFFTFLDIGLTVSANRGVYTSYGLVKDDPGAGGNSVRTYAFETQEIMVGGNRTGGAGGLQLAVDIFIDPLVGTTTQPISFQSFVSGGSMPYSYQWTVRHVGTGTLITFANQEQHNVPNPVFVGVNDALDEANANGFTLDGDYEVQLVVVDSFGAIAGSRTVVFTLKEAQLSAQLLASPPSATVDEAVNFVVYIDGGRPPYQVDIFYDDPNDPARGDSTTTRDRFAFFTYSYDAVWVDRSTPPNGRYDDPEDGVNPWILVTDSVGNRVTGLTGDPDFSINAVQKVLVGERLPLNITLLASPTSGTSNFDIQVNYAVAGGRKFSGDTFGQLGRFTGGRTVNAPQLGASDDYFVTIALVDTGGETPSRSRRGRFANPLFGPFASGFRNMVFRTEATTIIDPYGDDGIFMNGDSGEVYDPVYLHVPYPGNFIVMAFVTDGGGQWAVDQTMIYSEGYLSPVSSSVSGAPKVRLDRDGRPLHAVRIWTDPLYTDAQYGDYDSNEFRLREADLQIFGDLLTVDPNPSYYSPGMFAAKDPGDASLYNVNYLLDPETSEPVDFYDTFTLGRVNINTASEEVLASVFSKIIKSRAYHVSDDPNGTWRRGDRDYANDVYLTADEARALARAVVEYRNAYYDAYKPEVSGYAGFTYTHGVSANPYQSGAIRADHLPVIGPWDGANPRVYDVGTGRDDPPPDFDNAVENTWDNFRGNYYNLESNNPSTGYPLRFYAPSDIAVIREQLPGESDELYSKYLNDVLDNRALPSDPMGIDNTAGFDARHYFTYDPSANEDRDDARNEVSVINSNGETGYTFIPNPPFQSIFDLYKVVGVSDPELYELLDPQPRSFRVADQDGDGKYDLELDSDGFTIWSTPRTLSGPSLFRYAEVWDALENRFLPVANYLDDIAPFITTRSYTYRIKGFGGVDISGYGETVPVTIDRIDRDKSVTKIVDVGKMRTPSDETRIGEGLGRRSPYVILYEERSSGAGE